jgi:hypothetical protein
MLLPMAEKATETVEPEAEEEAGGTSSEMPRRSGIEANLRDVASRGAHAAEVVTVRGVQAVESVAAKGAKVAEAAASRGAKVAEAAEATAIRGAKAAEAAATRGVQAAEAVAARGAVVAEAAAIRGAEAAEVVASRSVAVGQAAMRGVKTGFETAKSAIEKNRAEWDRIAEGAHLPAVGAAEPLADLAARLDSDASLWRAFALRSMKPGAAQLIAIATAVIGIAGGTSLALLGGLRGLLGSATSAPVLWASAGALVLGGAIALFAAWWLHRTSMRSALEALSRADQAERRLERAAVVLAMRRTDEAAYRDALLRFEKR